MSDSTRKKNDQEAFRRRRTGIVWALVNTVTLVLASLPGVEATAQDKGEANRPSQRANANRNAALNQNPSESFEQGSIAFGRGEYRAAVDILRPLLYPDIRLESEGEVVRAHRMLAVAHLFIGQEDLAEEEFIGLLQLRPDYRFDPLLDPPLVVSFFGTILKEQEAEIAALDARRRAAHAAEKKRQHEFLNRGQPEVIEKHFVHNSYLLNFVPFGAGQFQNNQNTKGWLFLGSEGILALASVATFTSNFAIFGFRPTRGCKDPTATPCAPDRIDTSEEKTSRQLSNVATITGGLFFAIAAWGIVDALLNYESQTSIAPKTRKKIDLSVSPMILPHGGGAGVGLRF